MLPPSSASIFELEFNLISLFCRVSNAAAWYWDLASNSVRIIGNDYSGAWRVLSSWEDMLDSENMDLLGKAAAKAVENKQRIFSLTCKIRRPNLQISSVTCHGMIVNCSGDGSPPRYVVGFFAEQNSLAIEASREAITGLSDGPQTRFLANMSHEIRTPLNGILGMIELALDIQPNSEIQHYLQGIRSSSVALLRILDDILDFSKITGGYIKFEKEPFSIRSVVEDVIALFAPDANRKNLEFVCIVSPDVPSRMHGDSGRIRQVLFNLVGNAIKFTKTGSTTLRIGGERHTSTQFLLKFQIADTGIGIPSERFEAIFSPFVQIDNSTSRSFGGSGLGLSISKTLIEGMGGRIRVESSPGKGSTFECQIEVGIDSPETITSGVASSQSLRILVSYSLPCSGRALTELLIINGHRAILCESVEASIEELRRADFENTPFDLWFLDSELAAKDDIALLRRYSGCMYDTNFDRCVLVSGALRYSSDSVICRIFGIHTRLRAPWLDTSVQEAISSALLGNRPTPNNDNLKPVDLHLLEQGISPEIVRHSILLVDDDPMNLEVLHGTLERSGFDVAIAENGEIALRMFEKNRFDAVVMDIQMPVMDGISATQGIRTKEMGRSWVTSPHHHPIPIVGLTADVHSAIKAAAIEAGMNEVLIKPVTKKVLISTIEKWIQESMLTLPYG